MKGLIFKSVIVFLVCCIAYTAIVKLVDFNEYTAINQFQGNKIAKETFFFENTGKSHFIVGSSLSYRLKNDLFPDYYENLALGGSSSLNGLNLLSNKDVIPEVLLIETNILTRSKVLEKTADKPEKSLFSNFEKLLKGNFSITRQKNQPVSFGLNYFYNLMKGTSSTATKNISPKAKELMRSKQAEEYSITAERDIFMEVTMENLHFYIDNYIAKGTSVLFMELPISCELIESNKMVSMRTLMRESFPPTEYTYIDNIDCSTISTSDGTHLDQESAKLMVDHILTEVTNKIAQ